MADIVAKSTSQLIGSVVRKSGIPIKAIRYYEGLGLIKADRTEGGFRLFNSDVISRLNFIKLAQSSKMRLIEIK